jgi:type IV secretory pathway TrbD component
MDADREIVVIKLTYAVIIFFGVIKLLMMWIP